VIDEVRQILKTNENDIYPIKALILDFKMPIKNGLEVVKEVKELYAETRNKISGPLKEPFYLFVTSFANSKSFNKHCKDQGVDYLFEKPL
jgi:response regulator RpfG family c-di-GMP phosphodiesterase